MIPKPFENMKIPSVTDESFFRSFDPDKEIDLNELDELTETGSGSFDPDDEIDLLEIDSETELPDKQDDIFDPDADIELTEEVFKENPLPSGVEDTQNPKDNPRRQPEVQPEYLKPDGQFETKDLDTKTKMDYTNSSAESSVSRDEHLQDNDIKVGGEKDSKPNEITDNKLRELTDEEKEVLKNETHLSERAIDNIWVDENGNYHLKCRKRAIETNENNSNVDNVEYKEKTITVDGIDIIVEVPEFPVEFEIDISSEIWDKGDNAVFTECTKQLKEYIEAHPEMKLKFNEQQLEQIKNGEPRIKGYTWHHNEVPGKMQLVETKIHANTPHTGGNHIWCGGRR